MNSDDRRPDFLTRETWDGLDDDERLAVLRLVQEAVRSRRELDHLRGEAARLRSEANQLEIQVRRLSDQGRTDPGEGKLTTFSDELTELEPDEEVEEEEAKQRRVNVVAEVTLHTQTGNYTGFSENLSAGGVFVAMWDPPEIGTEASIDLTAPGVGRLSAPGIVRWHRTASNGRKTGCGVAFENLTPASLARVTKLITLIGEAASTEN